MSPGCVFCGSVSPRSSDGSGPDSHCSDRNSRTHEVKSLCRRQVYHITAQQADFYHDKEGCCHGKGGCHGKHHDGECCHGEGDAFWLYLDQVSYSNRAMQWGVENEEEARELYERKTGYEVRELSSVAHATIDNYAASPDGVVEKSDICVEIKCPKPETAVRYMANITDGETLKKEMPDYYWQVQAEMDCTEAKGCDFVVYCPFLDKPIHIVRVARNDEDILEMHERIALADKYIADNIIKTDKTENQNGDNGNDKSHV